ncbi:MAG: helix-turn-helix domain-containing protein [Rhodomicrobium sp.]
MSDEHKTQELVFGPRLRTLDAARYLGVARQTLARWRYEGVGPAFHKLSGAIVVYGRDDLDRWLNERRASSNAEVFARQEVEGATGRAKHRGRSPKAPDTAKNQAA